MFFFPKVNMKNRFFMLQRVFSIKANDQVMTKKLLNFFEITYIMYMTENKKGAGKMKKIVWILLAFALTFACSAYSETNSEWTIAPVITKAYELSSERIYLEWQGNAAVYQVYMDGASVASVIVNNAVISVKKGTHTIMIYPIYEIKNADTTLNIGVDVFKIGGSIGLDLASLGLDPKQLVSGNPSEPLYIDYLVDPVYNSAPEKLAAVTDYEDRVLLSFTDLYNADEFLVTIKKGNDANYVRYNINDEVANQFISKSNTITTLILDQNYLNNQGCVIPELNEKYNFSVQLRKYAVNLINKEKEKTVIHESRNSGGYDYTVTAAWKKAPVITYASQTADGQITLKWDHESGDRECEYSIQKINKTLGIKTGEETWGTTKEKEFVVHDLMNGGYAIAVFPQFNGEKGNLSSEVSVEIKNDWVAAPVLTCVQTSKNEVKLTWDGATGVEEYHIIVYAGDSGSLLRFVDMDYSKYTEFVLSANNGKMEQLFTYDKEYNSEAGLKLKFEIYGLRHTANGSEQKSATSSQTITIK